MLIIPTKGDPDSIEMDEARKNNKDVKDLVRRKPYVEFARPDRFGDTGDEEESTQAVDETFQKVVRHSRANPHLAPSIEKDAMHDGCKSRQCGGNECVGPGTAVFETLGSWVQDECGSDGAQSEDHRPVGDSEEWLAIEAYVNAGEEASKDQSQDANIVNPEHQVGER